MRTVLMLGLLVAACAPAAVPAPMQTAAAPVEPTAVMTGQVGLMDYIYGPPPRTRVDPGIRCRFHCPDAVRPVTTGSP